MSNWYKIDPFTDWEIPTDPGCYVIFYNRHPMYVGQTRNLRKRFQSYGFRETLCDNKVTPWGTMEGRYVKVTCKARKSKRFGDWAMLELQLIRRIQPMFNCVGSVKKRANNGTR